MNLFDIVKRLDHCLEYEGDISCCTYKPSSSNRSYFSVKMGPLSTLRIRRIYEVNEFSVNDFDTCWQLFSDAPGGSASCIDFEILIESGSPSQSVILYTSVSSNSETIVLRSPEPSSTLDSGDLLMRNKGTSTFFIAISPVTSNKQFLINSCKGKGVELGPGVNPHIIASEDVDVFYIEPKNSEQWIKTYNASCKAIDPALNHERFIFGDARDINKLFANRLGFIYSNHVIEHLLNPILVISNSLACLQVNGIFTGSVPSCANTFDLRQNPSSLCDLIYLEEKDFRDIPLECYQRWVLRTEPRTTIESLVERSYSIHITFWSVGLLNDLFDLLIRRGLALSYEILYAPNAKDIQFILRSAGASNVT